MRASGKESLSLIEDSKKNGASTGQKMVITATPSGRSPPRPDDKQARYMLSGEFFLEYSSCKSEMGWPPASEGVRHRSAGMDVRFSLTANVDRSRCRFFVRRWKLSEANTNQGLGKLLQSVTPAEKVDMHHLKRDVNRRFRVEHLSA